MVRLINLIYGQVLFYIMWPRIYLYVLKEGLKNIIHEWINEVSKWPTRLTLCIEISRKGAFRSKKRVLKCDAQILFIVIFILYFFHSIHFLLFHSEELSILDIVFKIKNSSVICLCSSQNFCWKFRIWWCSYEKGYLFPFANAHYFISTLFYVKAYYNCYTVLSVYLGKSGQSKLLTRLLKKIGISFQLENMN